MVDFSPGPGVQGVNADRAEKESRCPGSERRFKRPGVQGVSADLRAECGGEQNCVLPPGQASRE